MAAEAPSAPEPSETPESALGRLAAQALDIIRGRELEAALIMVVVDAGPDENGVPTSEAQWFTPDGQLRYTTIGMVERLRHNLVD